MGKKSIESLPEAQQTHLASGDFTAGVTELDLYQQLVQEKSPKQLKPQTTQRLARLGSSWREENRDKYLREVSQGWCLSVVPKHCVFEVTCGSYLFHHCFVDVRPAASGHWTARQGRHLKASVSTRHVSCNNKSTLYSFLCWRKPLESQELPSFCNYLEIFNVSVICNDWADGTMLHKMRNL